MKKKIISLCLVIALALTAIGGATLAYFTDTDNAENTFTVGNVKIDLIEQERKTENGETKLVDFEQNKPLNPIVGAGDESGPKDEHGLPIAKNYVDKVVTIKNDNSSDAWVRAYFAIPSFLDDGYETYNADMNVLHFNFGYYYDSVKDKWESTIGNQWIWKHGENDSVWNYFETNIDGVDYNVYYADYSKPLAKNETTMRLINGVYLDATFNYDYVTDATTGKTTASPYIVKNGQKVTIDVPVGWNWNTVKCPVFAVAVQAAGFSSAKEAVEAAFGTQYNPWGTTIKTNSWK